MLQLTAMHSGIHNTPTRVIGALQLAASLSINVQPQLAASLSIYVQPQPADQIKDQAAGRGRTGLFKILGSCSDTKLAAAG